MGCPDRSLRKKTQVLTRINRKSFPLPYRSFAVFFSNNRRSTGAMHSGPSLPGLLTKRETGCMASASSGAGRRSGANFSRRCSAGSIQRSKSSGSRITGIRSCRAATVGLAAVVRMAQDSSVCEPSRLLQCSHNPAKARGRPSLR